MFGNLLALATNEVTTKMTEEAQLQLVMRKDPKKVEAGKRLAEYNFKKREELPKLRKLK